MHSAITKIETYVFEREPNDAYLGDLSDDDIILNEHHFVRSFNGTVYPQRDRSVVVRVEDKNGVVGWGETYGLVAPKIVAALIDDLFGPYLKALPPQSPDKVWDAFYLLQRNRGYWGGYLADTFAAIDIALWDLHARAGGHSIQAALGAPGTGIVKGYVSGLPKKTTEERVELAQSWKEKGFNELKIPISATNKGDVASEFEALRIGLGEDHKIALDMHWTKSAAETIALEESIRPFNPWFIEAPTIPEDIDAQIEIGTTIQTPLAIGEEWRTEWDYKQRQKACQIVQPEMGHTGITQFARIGKLAKANNAKIMPHATIGLGIFMAASLRASLAVGVEAHEFQHTIYHRNGALLDGVAPTDKGEFFIPDTPGHGVEPNADGLKHLTLLEV